MTTNKKIGIGIALVIFLAANILIISTPSRYAQLSSNVFGGQPPANFDIRFNSDREIHWMIVEAPGRSLLDFLENNGWSKWAAENFWASAPASGFDKIISSESLSNQRLTIFYMKELGLGQIGICAMIDQEVGGRDSVIFTVFRY